MGLHCLGTLAVSTRGIGYLSSKSSEFVCFSVRLAVRHARGSQRTHTNQSSRISEGLNYAKCWVCFSQADRKGRFLYQTLWILLLSTVHYSPGIWLLSHGVLGCLSTLLQTLLQIPMVSSQTFLILMDFTACQKWSSIVKTLFFFIHCISEFKISVDDTQGCKSNGSLSLSPAWSTMPCWSPSAKLRLGYELSEKRTIWDIVTITEAITGCAMLLSASSHVTGRTEMHFISRQSFW